MARLWHDRPGQKAGTLLLELLEKSQLDRKTTTRVAQILGNSLAASGTLAEDMAECAAESTRSCGGVAAVQSKPMAATPKEIYNAISAKIHGQSEAVKAAAITMYNTLNGRRSNVIFYGPTGSGKTEIWRQMQRLHPESVRIADASQLIAEGWRGGVHLSDILYTLTPQQIKHGAVLVLDESDKILCEQAIGGAGTDYNLLVQNNLLTLMDGGTLEFSAADGHKAFTVDCSHISVVITGVFERLSELKKLSAKPRLGFVSCGVDSGTISGVSDGELTAADLIKAGMRRELAGRISRIARVNPLTAADMLAIARQEVKRLGKQIRREVSANPDALVSLSEMADKKGLGARWLKSQLGLLLDEQLFADPNAPCYHLEMAVLGADERHEAAEYAA